MTLATTAITATKGLAVRRCLFVTLATTATVATNCLPVRKCLSVLSQPLQPPIPLSVYNQFYATLATTVTNCTPVLV